MTSVAPGHAMTSVAQGHAMTSVAQGVAMTRRSRYREERAICHCVHGRPLFCKLILGCWVVGEIAAVHSDSGSALEGW